MTGKDDHDPEVCMINVLSNFCFENFLVSCAEVGQDCRGPYSPSGVVEDRSG